HFLFNTLNAISSLVEGKETPRASEMIVQLSNFLRYSLASDPIRRVTLKEELDALNLYLSIEQTRFGDRLVVHFDIAKDVEMIKVPSLILQPLVENAIKYAIAPVEKGGKISVYAFKDGENLVLKLTDTGPGIKATKKDIPTHGVGLQNTKNRLQTFYGDDYEFSIDDGVEGGTVVYMKIPPKKTIATVVNEVFVGG
ncbi:MAG: histidine kinase, partial [Gammaproteobacteria bacterium]|nr:histidine kinase [Gammaproteobacteria bacterium]